jgi:streptogramin lyase
MLQTFSRRTLILGSALAFAAGCSSNSMAPSQSSSVMPTSRYAGEKMRVFPGPAVIGPIVVPAVAHKPNAPAGWPDAKKKKKKKSILFVADSSSGVLMYNPNKANSSPIGSITTGTSSPFGLAVDKKGALYVANIGNNTVTIYPKGKSSPSMTISAGLSAPYGIGVDSKGNIFVSNLGPNDITEYPAGATTPSQTISFASEGQAIGVGVDGKDNVWVACDNTNAVFEIPAGSTTPQNANLSGLAGSIGVSFGAADIMYVSNFGGSNVQVYKYGTTTPETTITSGIGIGTAGNGPTLGGFTFNGSYFQSNQGLNVVGYKKGKTTPFSTLMGASSPVGVASEPLIKK